MITKTDRYYIERKYHDPEKEFNAFKRMAYHGIGYIEESGLDDAELLKGLEPMTCCGARNSLLTVLLPAALVNAPSGL